MGKVKLLHDVITIMKDKEFVQGNIKVEGSIDEVRIFTMNNAFEKNMAEGRTKAKVSLEADCSGKKVRHESSTEFGNAGSDNCEGHSLMRRSVFDCWHSHYSHHSYQDSTRCYGIKAKLSKLAFAVSMLHSMKIEAQEDKSTLLSLDLDDMPGDMKTLLHHAHCSHGAFKEFSGMEVGNTLLTIRINENNEIEKALLYIKGKTKDESGAPHHLNFQVELDFVWQAWL